RTDPRSTLLPSRLTAVYSRWLFYGVGTHDQRAIGSRELQPTGSDERPPASALLAEANLLRVRHGVVHLQLDCVLLPARAAATALRRHVGRGAAQSAIDATGEEGKSMPSGVVKWFNVQRGYR